jgi:hypothetical protein
VRGLPQKGARSLGEGASSGELCEEIGRKVGGTGRGILARGEESSSHHNAERGVCCVAAGADLAVARMSRRLLRAGLVGRGLAAGGTVHYISRGSSSPLAPPTPPTIALPTN